jgi:SAM-dependent methyltransferase
MPGQVRDNLVIQSAAASATAARLDSPYDAAFYASQHDGSLRSARVVVPYIVRLMNPNSVVDIGCGLGTWLRAFVENGVAEVLGVDGDYVDRSRLLFDAARFRAMDLTHPASLGRTFDLAVCLEVGEHLPTRAAQALVALLTSAAPVVLFSAAMPGQGGTNHINEQWPEFWERLFGRHQFVRLDPVRRMIVFDTRVEPWYQQNTLLYASRAAIARSPALQVESDWVAQNNIELIWRRNLSNFTSFMGMLKLLPAAGWRALKNRLSGCG